MRRIRNDLGAELDIDAFEHRSFYNVEQGRIDMFLVSRKKQTIRLGPHRFYFEKGETIHTEWSYEYHPEEFRELARKAGFDPETTWMDSRGLFSVHYLSVPSERGPVELATARMATRR